MSSLKRKASNLVSTAKKPKQDGSIMSFFGGPKSTSATSTSGTASGSGVAPPSSSPAAPEPPAPKFNKEKWVAGLTPEQKELLQLEIDTLDDSWLVLLKDEVTSKEFLDLKRFLNRETEAGKKWFPPKEDVYSWYV
jgi:uracil-DNA glycosylase